MEILTLLRANVKRKKGTFFGILFLMILVAALLTMLFSIKKNVTKSIDEAYIEAKAGDVFMNIPAERLTPELLNSVKEHPLVDHVETMDAILMRKRYIRGKEDNESWLIVPLNDVVTHQFADDSFSSYKDHVDPLSETGIYFPQGISTNTGCKTGDEIRFLTRGGEYTFQIQGFVVEPVCGSSMVGWKTVYVSPETFEKLAADVDKGHSEFLGRVTIVYLYKKADCDMNLREFAKKINLDTGIQNYSYSAETSTQMKYYTGLFSDIICSIMIVFAIILAVVVVIIMAHNISVTIEESYTELGILKAQGFTKGKIRLLYTLMYMLTQLLGAIIGTVVAIPLIHQFGNIFQPITGIIAKKTVDLSMSMPILLLFMVLSFLVILLATRKIGKISPVKALTGETRDVYFDNLLTAPVSGKRLSLSLAYRQFSSNKKRYFVAIFICALLMFFMLTVNLMASSVRSKSALEAMGAVLCEVEVRSKETNFTEKEMEEFEKLAAETAKVENEYFIRSEYVSLNGETIQCQIRKDVSSLKTVSGRAPLYDNEVALSTILRDELKLSVGDKVTVARREFEEEYVISGIYTTTNDTGRQFLMGGEAAEKIEATGYSWYGISLADIEDTDKMGEAFRSAYGDKYSVDANKDPLGSEVKEIRTAVDAMRYVIYVFSILFVLVVVSMICSRVFSQERRDLGIYKAVGFTSGKLRFQFALRFFLISIIGSAIGLACSIAFSQKTLNTMLRSVGVTDIAAPYSTETLLIPVVLLLAGFFIFAYLVSRRIRKVEIRELVIE